MVLAAVKPLRNRPNPGVETSLVRARPGPEKGVYNGNSGSRRALRRAVVAEGEVVERTKLQRIEEAVRESCRITIWAVRRGAAVSRPETPSPAAGLLFRAPRGPQPPVCRDTTKTRAPRRRGPLV